MKIRYNQSSNATLRLRPFRLFELLNPNSKYSKLPERKNPRRERKLREFYLKMSYIREKNLMKKMLDSWTNFIFNQRQEAKKFMMIRSKVNTETMNTLFTVWRESALPRSNKYRSAAYLAEFLSLKLQRQGFDGLINNEMMMLQMDDIENESNYFYVMKLKKKSFEGLLLNKARKEKETGQIAVASFVKRRRLFQFLVGVLGNHAMFKKNRRMKTEFVCNFYNARLKSRYINFIIVLIEII